MGSHSCTIVTAMVTNLIILTILGSSLALPQVDVLPRIPVFNISLTQGCLQCGSPCLSAVQEAVPVCVAAGLLDAGPSLFSCVRDVIGASSACRDCLASLVCCVTDSCSYCTCDCHNLLQFSAPPSSPTRLEHPWLFDPKCHFAYRGAPPCRGCDGRRVYQSVGCKVGLYLHYHDHLLDGRWVVTTTIDSHGADGLVRNLGDGLDDEECPEKETWGWQFRSRKTPGWLTDMEVQLKWYNPASV